MKAIAILIFVMSTFFSAKISENPSKVQQRAYGILETKCNVCHRSKNPKKVFTIENMNSLAPKINRQVFVWKRMPKGKEIKLTEEEKEQLQSWINNI